ncbi:LysR family transcriptional regulator [Psychromonas aquimarina]|uniref:LysR family transcriptional regulator n=1 Tax=Psychromonas aquimarina TaxID=444919 RepID=UPI00041CADB1|nr:LysR family transcriptional regulator [Psychromonas aquimarina]
MNKVDLNLLFTLRVLLKEKSTTIAADKLNTSQSAVSRSLIKLRELMSDELLVRKGQQLELTVRGEELAAELPAMMEQLSGLFNRETFDPLLCREKITIAMNASIAEWVVPPFLHYLSTTAPSIMLTIDDWGNSTPEQLLKGDVRLGLNYFPLELPKSFIQRRIGEDSFVLVCSKTHPLSQEKFITLEHIRQYSSAVHIMKDWNDEAPKAEAELQKHGVDLNVQIRSRHLSIILRILLESDLILFSARRAAEQLDSRYAVIPFAEEVIQPKGDIGLFYANRYCSDPLTKWLEHAIKKVIIENNES